MMETGVRRDQVRFFPVSSLALELLIPSPRRRDASAGASCGTWNRRPIEDGCVSAPLGPVSSSSSFSASATSSSVATGTPDCPEAAGSTSWMPTVEAPTCASLSFGLRIEGDTRQTRIYGHRRQPANRVRRARAARTSSFSPRGPRSSARIKCPSASRTSAEGIPCIRTGPPGWKCASTCLNCAARSPKAAVPK